MKKVCPVCRQSPQDDMLVKCEKCKVPFVDEASLKLSLSADELRQVTSAQGSRLNIQQYNSDRKRKIKTADRKLIELLNVET